MGIIRARGSDPSVLSFLEDRGVERLVHFTPSRNLLPIFRVGELRPASDLNAEVLTIHANTDPHRHDGHADRISFSLQYPNPYYFRTARGKTNAQNFPDWAILFAKPAVAAKSGTLFSPANAALGSGRHLASGVRGLAACYSNPESSSGRVLFRGPQHKRACPTNLQSEVLVPGPIPLSEVFCIVLPTELSVAQERTRLRMFGANPDAIKWATSQHLFDVEHVRLAVQQNQLIDIVTWSNGKKEKS